MMPLQFVMEVFISGYKLAFNYLKAKRHVDAIDVCHKVRGIVMLSFVIVILSMFCILKTY